MGAGVLLTIGSLLYIILLVIVYYSKEKMPTLENKIFKMIMMTSLIGIIIHLFLYMLMIGIGTSNIITILISKLYLVYLITWMILFTLYVFIISSKNKQTIEKTYKNVMQIIVVVILSLSVVIFMLPLNFHSTIGQMYSYGYAVYFVYLISAVLIILNNICLFKNIRRIIDKKYAPLLLYMFLGIVVMIVQYNTPWIQLITSLEAFIVMLMYFTIENPDIKTIKELTYSKEMLEKANNATMNSLNNLSLSTTNSLSKLLSLSNKKVDKSNIEEVIDETDNMKKMAVELVDQINGIIDLSKIESSKYELVKNNYNLYELVVQIRDLFDSKLGNKKIKIKDNIKEDMPNILYGDSEKIKQAVIYLFNSLITNYNISNMEYRVFTLKVRSLYRLKISLILDYKEIEEYLENKNGKQIINLKGLDYKILEKLITLLHGSYDVIISNNKVAFTISIDQKDVLEYNNINNIKEEKRSKIDIFNASDKRVLIVDDNRNKIKEIVRMLTPYNIDVSVAHDYQEYNDLLYSNKTWDLILLDDMMPDSKKFEYLDYNHLNNQVFERIEKIAGYKISVVVMLTPNKIGIEKRYDDAKIDYILKPIDEVKLNKILKKYLLNNK